MTIQVKTPFRGEYYFVRMKLLKCNSSVCKQVNPVESTKSSLLFVSSFLTCASWDRKFRFCSFFTQHLGWNCSNGIFLSVFCLPRFVLSFRLPSLLPSSSTSWLCYLFPEVCEPFPLPFFLSPSNTSQLFPMLKRT